MPTRDQLIHRILTHNVAEVIERAHLERVLRGAKKLRVKLGIDPTSSDLHLGHAVVLRKLKEFQDVGHKVVLIIGDFTAQVGDPSGRSETRKPLSEKEIRNNMRKYLVQAGKILDIKKTEVQHNSSWFRKEGVGRLLELASASSMQQVLHRADFSKRLKEGSDVTLLEVFYPLLQGYDSVKVKADVEVGGTDQKFNLLMGRRIQRHFGTKEQDVITLPLLLGTDGVRKMSKSFGNSIALTDPPDEMFGKIMRIPDVLIGKYFELCTDPPKEGDGRYRRRPTQSPRDAKLLLACKVVHLYHGKVAADEAAKSFLSIFSKREISGKLPELRLPRPVSAVELVIRSGVTLDNSNSKARRLIIQGGLRVDGRKVTDPNETFTFRGGEVVKIGKRHFFRVK